MSAFGETRIDSVNVTVNRINKLASTLQLLAVIYLVWCLANWSVTNDSIDTTVYDEESVTVIHDSIFVPVEIPERTGISETKNIVYKFVHDTIIRGERIAVYDSCTFTASTKAKVGFDSVEVSYSHPAEVWAIKLNARRDSVKVLLDSVFVTRYKYDNPFNIRAGVAATKQYDGEAVFGLISIGNNDIRGFGELGVGTGLYYRLGVSVSTELWRW